MNFVQTQDLKQRIRKHNNDIHHPNISTIKRCLRHHFFKYFSINMLQIITYENSNKGDLLFNGDLHLYVCEFFF